MNKAIHIHNAIQSLLEKNFTGKYYLSAYKELPKLSLNKIIFSIGWDDELDYFSEPNPLSRDLFGAMTRDDVSAVILKFTKDTLGNYRKNLANGNSSHTIHSYIYEYNSPMSLLNLDDEKEVMDAIDSNIFYCSNSGEVSRNKDIERIFKFIKGRNYIKLIGMLNYGNFKEQYDGFSRDKERLFVINVRDSVDFFSLLKLVDGNATRFDTGMTDELSMNRLKNIPDSVISDVIGYTTNFKHQFKEETIDWLLNNLDKPYSQITIYRGLGISGNKELSIDDCIEDLNNIIHNYLGLNSFNELRVGNTVLMNRNRSSSSWSTNPKIARSFSRGEDTKDINLLIKATVPASQVLFDFNILPREYIKNTFHYWLENEVIAYGKINATINDIWTNPNGLFKPEFLNHMGFSFKSGVGFIEIL